MPIYDLAAVAEALDLGPKQLDNILSRNSLPGVERKKRGVARRISSDVAAVICLARELSVALGVPLANVLRFAQATSERATQQIELGQFTKLSIDQPRLRASVADRLDAAVETVGRRRRGRPPKRREAN